MRRLERREREGWSGSFGGEEHAPKARSTEPGARLQQTLGNRALRALLGEPARGSGLVLHAPDGAMEQEAHRVAAEVTGGATRGAGLRVGRGEPGLARAASEPVSGDMQGGLPLGEEWRERLSARRGAGRPIEVGARGELEARLGVGIDAVRVHHDGAAAGLCRDLKAEAFTHGSDIYFAEGRYAPGTTRGASLLAHEVTHTIQQRGLVREGGRAAVRGGGEASAAIQGLVSRADFVSLAGGNSAYGWMKGSRYYRLLASIDAYHAAGDAEGRGAALDEIVRIGRLWEAGHTGDASGDTRRRYYISGLIAEAEAEKAGRPVGPAHTSPTQVIESRTQAGDAVVNQAGAAVQVQGRKYKFMVRALIEHPLYGKFAQRRAEMVAANKFKVGKWRKTSAELKQEAAKEVVLANQPELGEEGRRRELRDAADRVSAAGVGHTWVVFQQTDDQDREVDRKSFGLYPAIPLGQAPLEARPGDVKHPDHHDAHGGNIRQRAWDLGFATYKEGLAAAGRWMRSPPDYTLTSCNCTYFAKMVAEAVGVQLPDAYFTLPNLTSLWNPNTLHDLLA